MKLQNLVALALFSSGAFAASPADHEMCVLSHSSLSGQKAQLNLTFEPPKNGTVNLYGRLCQLTDSGSFFECRPIVGSAIMYGKDEVEFGLYYVESEAEDDFSQFFVHGTLNMKSLQGRYSGVASVFSQGQKQEEVFDKGSADIIACPPNTAADDEDDKKFEALMRKLDRR